MSYRQMDTMNFKRDLDAHIMRSDDRAERKSQKQRLLELLRAYEIVPLPMILSMSPHIACYTKRISLLRKDGWDIECLKEWKNGELHTSYKLTGVRTNCSFKGMGLKMELVVPGLPPKETKKETK